MAYIQAESLLSDPEYINIVYVCLHANYLNKILFKPKVELVIDAHLFKEKGGNIVFGLP